MTEDTGDTRR